MIGEIETLLQHHEIGAFRGCGAFPRADAGR
jgi:hypothetical protein